MLNCVANKNMKRFSTSSGSLSCFIHMFSLHLEKYESYEFMIKRYLRIIFSGQYTVELYPYWFGHYRQELGLTIILNCPSSNYTYKIDSLRSEEEDVER
ncbi:hypothetical protein YC2023_039941 [Brassica napus]